jgi:hypothetical protein
MKHLFALLIGLGTVSSVACQAHQHVASPGTEVVTIALSKLR